MFGWIRAAKEIQQLEDRLHELEPKQKEYQENFEFFKELDTPHAKHCLVKSNELLNEIISIKAEIVNLYRGGKREE
jgi:hypothetical protein